MSETSHLVLEDRSFDNNGRIPNRHAAPSAPWPWLDISDGRYFPTPLPFVHRLKITAVDPVGYDPELQPVSVLGDHKNCDNICWEGYPISCFPNWTMFQVKKSKILNAVECYDRRRPCTLFYVDVDDKGRFSCAKETVIRENEVDQSWQVVKADGVCSNYDLSENLIIECPPCDSDPLSLWSGQSFSKICQAPSYKCSEQSKSFCLKRLLPRPPSDGWFIILRSCYRYLINEVGII